MKAKKKAGYTRLARSRVTTDDRKMLKFSVHQSQTMALLKLRAHNNFSRGQLLPRRNLPVHAVGSVRPLVVASPLHTRTLLDNNFVGNNLPTVQCVQHRTLSSKKLRHTSSFRKAAAMRKQAGTSPSSKLAEKKLPPMSVTSSSSSSSDDSDSKFALPDRDKELELTRLQDEVARHYKEGDYRRALKTSQELLEESQNHFGRDHPATASAFNNSALMHKLLGNFDESRKDFRAALTIYKQVVGDDHASYASALHNLGNLNRSQIHFDESLKATDRLSLIEQAAEFLERAWRIRQDELGEHHPHTVASRSSWGSTLAEQILHHHKQASSSTTKSGGAVVSQQYVSLLSAGVTQHGWVAAEEHLRQALKTAIENPRGPSVEGANSKKAQKGKKKANNSPPKQKDAASSSSAAATNTISTLSACSAAQNLAVFLKARATKTSPYNQEWLQEAHQLYLNVLETRQQLLPTKGHPDLYATTFSLAELLQAMGDEKAANVIRQEIVDTYDPPAAPKNQGDEGDEDVDNDTTQHSDSEAVVTQTKVEKSKMKVMDD